MPIALVFVLQFLFTIIQSFKRFISEDIIYTIKVILMMIFGIMLSIIYGSIIFKFYLIIIYCILITCFLISIIICQVDNLPKKYLGFSFILFQLYSIISWWFV